MESAQVTPPADWYRDPEDFTKERYWDGETWTAHMRSRSGPAAQTSSSDIPVAPGTGYGEPVVVNPGMMHSLFLLAGSFLLAGGTAGFGIISTVFAALATWASYRSAQAKNRGDIEAAASSAKDARRWRKVTWVALVVIGVLAVAVYAVLLLFVVAAEMSYAY